MKKQELTSQFDEVLSVIRKWLDSARKEVFKFHIKTVKPAANELFGNIKQSIEHSDLEEKLKKSSITQGLIFSRFVVWLGIATSVMGVLILLSPSVFIGWQLFLIPLVAILGPWIFDFFRESSEEAKDTVEGYDGRQFIGKVHRLKNPIVNGELELTVMDVTWTLKGDDCPSGDRVKIVAVSKTVLYVVGV